MAEACGTSVFHISLDRKTVPPDKRGVHVLRALVNGALQQGMAIMNTAIYDTNLLREAQLHPEAHGDLIVRVWGFSARFVDLQGDMQEHVIKRVLDQSQP